MQAEKPHFFLIGSTGRQGLCPDSGITLPAKGYACGFHKISWLPKTQVCLPCFCLMTVWTSCAACVKIRKNRVEDGRWKNGKSLARLGSLDWYCSC